MQDYFKVTGVKGPFGRYQVLLCETGTLLEAREYADRVRHLYDNVWIASCNIEFTPGD